MTDIQTDIHTHIQTDKAINRGPPLLKTSIDTSNNSNLVKFLFLHIFNEHSVKKRFSMNQKFALSRKQRKYNFQGHLRAYIQHRILDVYCKHQINLKSVSK